MIEKTLGIAAAAEARARLHDGGRTGSQPEQNNFAQRKSADQAKHDSSHHAVSRAHFAAYGNGWRPKSPNAFVRSDENPRRAKGDDHNFAAVFMHQPRCRVGLILLVV